MRWILSVAAVILFSMLFSLNTNLTILTNYAQSCQTLCLGYGNGEDACEVLNKKVETVKKFVESEVDIEQSTICLVKAATKKECGITYSEAVNKIMDNYEKINELPSFDECLLIDLYGVELSSKEYRLKLSTLKNINIQKE